MDVVGYAVFFATILLVAVVFPALSKHGEIAMTTPVMERDSADIRVVNSDRWTSSSSPNHGTILPRVERRMTSQNRRVDPHDLRALAASRARARARLAQRDAQMRRYGMSCGIAVLITLIAWILVVGTAFPAAVAILATVITVAGSGLFLAVLNRAREASVRDERAIEKINERLDKLTARARAQERPTNRVSREAKKKMPRQVARARSASASSPAAAGISAVSAASAPSTASAPASLPARSAPAISASEIRAAEPSYTPKPVFARRTVKPFEPEAAPTAAVPYRPKTVGERIAAAPSASSAEVAPVVASFNFDDVLEARRHA
ncbi:MAG: hypothetical protein Q4P33_06215 [Flaviflexus sp.]|nr:hypothetical protein [Flaviflexus sp.]